MSVTVQQVRWFKNGDHPDDRMGEPMHDPTVGITYPRREGAVVRCFRHPDVPGDSVCVCGARMHDHGWIDSPDGDGTKVCPGDLIVTEIHRGGRQVFWPDGSRMAQECTCRLREDMILMDARCPHHGIMRTDRERRTMTLAAELLEHTITGDLVGNDTVARWQTELAAIKDTR